MGFKAWNIRDLVMSLNAVPLSNGGNSGYADDEVFSLEWDEDSFTMYKGADGEITRVESNSDVAHATLRLAQTSDINDRLNALFIADKALPNGAGAGMFKANDKNGRLVILAERSWVVARPAVKRGKNIQVNEWKIDLADAYASFIGGR